MKKILLSLWSGILVSSPLVVTMNVSSCSQNSYKKTPHNIDVDTQRLLINVGDNDNIDILNVGDLESITTKVDDQSICSVSINNNKLTVTALKEGMTTITINAKNSIKPVSVSILTYSLASNIIGELKTYTDLLSILLPDFKNLNENDYAKLLSQMVSKNNMLISLIGYFSSGFLNKISLNSDLLSFVKKEVDISKYQGLTYEKVMQISSTRIISGILGLIAGDNYVKNAISLDYTNSDVQLTIFNNLSNILSKMVGPFSSLKKDNMFALSPTTIVYSAGEILNGLFGVLEYMNNFDLSSSESCTWDKINSIYDTKLDIDKANFSINQAAKNIESGLSTKQGMENMLRILFAQGDSKGKDANNDGCLINLVDDDQTKKITYAKYGLTSLLQSVVYGLIKNNPIFDKIPGVISMIISKENLKFSIANAIPNLLTYLSNGWDYNKIYVKIKMLFDPQYLPLEEVIKTIESLNIIPKEQLNIIGIIIKDPISYIFKILPKNNGQITLDFTFGNLVDILKLNINKDKVLGKWQNLKITDFIYQVCTSLKDSSTSLNINYLYEFIGSLLLPISESNKTIILQYLISNIGQLSSPNSYLWNYIGLVSNTDGTYNIRDNSTLFYAWKMASSKGSIKQIIMDINAIVKALKVY
ncbi:hypothetical protein [Spiroplasma endosymbiont of Aspidapion aeneum]|uniref:hypothetical protein n=1 Tax=Spiroplasma endosymbiont of Aspidapion aeneum TaxID=3066276 RepID=UPI00313E66FD